MLQKKFNDISTRKGMSDVVVCKLIWTKKAQVQDFIISYFYFKEKLKLFL